MTTALNVDRVAARWIADTYLDAVSRWDPTGPDIVIVDTATRETETHWVFGFEARRAVESGNPLDRLAGNSPIFIRKRDGAISRGNTRETIEAQLARPDPGVPVEWPQRDPGLADRILDLQRATAAYVYGDDSRDIPER